MKAFVGLGSNEGDRLENIRRALLLMAERGIAIETVSSLYETDPVGPPQTDFLNAVCKIDTDLAPLDLYRALKEIEAEVGRRPGPRWGPREIDLDLLLYEDLEIDEPDLKVPHPEMKHRAFVQIPLAEIAPGLAAHLGGGASEGVRVFRSGNWLQ